MTLRRVSLAMTLLACTFSVSSAAEQADSRLDAGARNALVGEITKTLETMYVDAAAGEKLAREIRRRAAEGAYDGAGTGAEFASRVTRDLQELGHDKHLAVLEEARHGATMRVIERRGGEPTAGAPGSPTRRVVRHPGGDSGPEAERWKRQNHGVQRAERLEGNVGYLRLTGFPSGDGARNALAGAMGVLAGTDSLIVDVRECPGGSPDTVNFLSSYFFGPEPVELLSRYDRRSDTTDKDMTLRELPGTRRADTDLSILTSSATGSACESFAYILQQHGRARVIGERTAGAGHLAARVPLGSGLVMSVSIGRPIHPRTGRGWEATGVVPDTSVPAASALAAAHQNALARLGERASDAAQKKRIAWARENAKARGETPAGAGPLTRYAGDYGERRVSVEGNALYFRGPSSRRWGPLLMVAADVFVLDEETRIRFERGAGGEVTGLRIERADGGVEAVAKGTAGSTAGDRAVGPLPDTPAGRRADAFFRVFTGPSREKSLAFITANHADSALAEMPAARRAERLTGIAAEHKGLRARRILSSEADKIVVLAQDAQGEWLEVTLRVEPEPPHKIVGVGLEQSEGDAAEREKPKASDDEVARAAGAYLRSLADADEFSGVVLLARNGNPFFQEAYGLADRERKVTNTPKTRFNIGSIDKTFTQVAIAQLAREGKLALSDTIRKHLPDYPSSAADRITLQHLLTMRSGLGDIFGDRYTAADKSRLARLSDFLPFFADKPLLFEPGEGRQYSNAGYVVLGLIIEKVTGREYHDYVNETIRVPAGMTDSGPVDPRGRSEFAIGYTRRHGDGNAQGPRTPNTAILPARSSSAGGSYATASDLLRFDAALRADRLLSTEYGNWIFGEKTSAPEDAKGRSGGFGIAGGLPGSNATLEMDLDRGYTVIVLSNYDPPIAERVGRKIREWLGL